MQYDDPNQQVFAIYRKEPDGSLVPNGWELTQAGAEERAKTIASLSDEPTEVKPTTRKIYSEQVLMVRVRPLT